MFRSFIYLNTDKMYEYMRLIHGTNKSPRKAESKKKTTGLNIGGDNLGFSHNTETSFDQEYEQDVAFDYDHFELALSQKASDDYFDIATDDGLDIATIPSMRIVRLCSPFSIPEAFDMVTLIDQFKPMLVGQIKTKSEGEKEALNNVLGNAEADIPIIIECEGITIAGKLSTKYLQEKCTELEEYEEQSVYLLCKTIGVNTKEQVDIFDPMKDFIKLPRVMRRKLEVDGKTIGLEKIRVTGPVLKVEIIAIYK